MSSVHPAIADLLSTVRSQWHILAIAQAICDYRKLQRIDGFTVNLLAISEIRFTNAWMHPLRRNRKPPLERLAPDDVHITEVAGEKVEKILSKAPGDGNSIGGIKVIAKNGCFAARPSGTEEIYKIYAESFIGQDHLRRLQEEAQTIVLEALTRSAQAAAGTGAARRSQ